MKLVLASLCAGAVVFMLRFLAAALKERGRLQRPVRVYFAISVQPSGEGSLQS